MAVFIASYIRRLDFSIISSTSIDMRFLLAALPFSILSRIFLPYIWTRLIKEYQDPDKPIHYWSLNYVYAKAWLGKYIPGKVAWIAGKVYFALGLGISKAVLGITSVLDTILQLLTALLIGVAFLFISGASSNFSAAYVMFFLASTVVGVVSITPPVFNRLLSSGYKILKKKELNKKYFVSLKVLVKIIPMYFLIHSLSSLPIYFLIRTLGFDLSFIDLVYVSGAFIFAGAVGTLAFFAPSGLGVREGIILLFLSNILPAEIGVIIVSSLRVWTIALDILYWALSLTVVKFRKLS